MRIDGDRQWTATLPGLDWGYKTTPQTNLNNRDFSYFRGKGLGGSSATNLEVYTIGPKDDYSEWAERVGDTDFAWESIKPRFRELENYHEPRSKYRKYVAGHESDHGQQGNLHIGFAETWEKDIPEMLDVFEKIGLEMNKDFNSGNPIGMGISPNSAFKGRRSTSADLLHDAPPNLVVKTDTRVTRVILQDGSAVGVETEGAECENTTSGLNITHTLTSD